MSKRPRAVRRINRFGRFAIAAIVAAGIAFVAVQLARPHTRVAGPAAGWAPQGPPRATVAQPLAGPAKKTSMAAATCALGVSVPVPRTSAVQPADEGAVWELTTAHGTEVDMAVTFPSKGLFIQYRRPSPWGPNPTEAWGKLAATLDSARVVELNGTTPAIAIDQNSDDTGENYGAIAFVVNGTEVRVLDHANYATLSDIAQSLLAQWPTETPASSQCPGPVGPTGGNGPTGASGPTGAGGHG